MLRVWRLAWDGRTWLVVGSRSFDLACSCTLSKVYLMCHHG